MSLTENIDYLTDMPLEGDWDYVRHVVGFQSSGVGMASYIVFVGDKLCELTVAFLKTFSFSLNIKTKQAKSK